MTTKNLIGSMLTSKNLNDTNYDISYLKVQFILNEGDMLEHLIVSMATLVDRNKHGKDITASE